MRIVIDMQGAQTESRFRGIGRYSMALAQAIVRNGREHEVWVVMNNRFPDAIAYIRSAFKELIPPERLFAFDIPTSVSWEAPSNNWRRHAAELIRQRFITELRPDIVHVSSLFEGAKLCDAVISVGGTEPRVPTAVTLYDLIPLLDPENYLGVDWIRKWYMDKIENLKRADLLLAISEYSRREAMEVLGIDGERVVSISSAHADIFRPCPKDEEFKRTLFTRYGITSSYLMYNGALELRKNLDRLLQAFALLPLELRTRHQLVFVGKVSDLDRIRLKRLASQLGIGEQFVLTGYVPDDELVALFTYCALFVFPSLHEGFGLPALEAMACGAPTIGSSITSIPEVIGRADALFDPRDPDDIAAKIVNVLTNESLRQSLCEHALDQAAKFSWDSCAKRAIAAFERLHERRSTIKASSWKVITAERAEGYSRLVRDIAEIPRRPVAPTDMDLIMTANCIDRNQQLTARIIRARQLPESITWRIEGPFDSSYSLALVNRETARALAALGHEVVLHSTEGPGDFPANEQFLANNPDLAKIHRRATEISQVASDVTSRNLYPPRVMDMQARLNFLHSYGWEESGFPHEWVESFNASLQGITVMSEHVRKVMIDNGVTVPLAVSGIGVDHWERIVPDTRFVLNARKFRFLHVSSCFPRKGADTMLDAYGRAFRAKDDVTLVIKTFSNPHNHIHRWLEEARAGDSEFPDVRIIEEDYSDAQMKALYKQCHALVAPSRAEGFGLPMAEAMLSGLAVITTNWSGQVDFCTPETAWLFDYAFTPAKTHFNLFDTVWAEPDVGQLARLLREIYDMPVASRAERTAHGKQLLLQKFRWSDVASRVIQSAREWAHMSEVKDLRIGWVTTWNTRCGIAAYSSHLLKKMQSGATILAARSRQLTHIDGSEVVRCWDAGENDMLSELAEHVEHHRINTLVVQFNYGFFNLENFSRFLSRQLDVGRIVVLMMHATSDPVHVLPHKRLEKIREPLSRCHRILVHAPADMNRLKALGLIENVALFPHGIPDYLPPVKQTTRDNKDFIIATYGFFLPHKGLLELIDAVALLRGGGMRIRLHMVNAEYPTPESAAMIREAKEKISELRLNNQVQMITDFLPDEESLALLAEADLIVFPYQNTGESSSAAVRYGLVTGRPVAVTPLTIFADVSPAVYTLPSQVPEQLANGIRQILHEVADASESALAKEVEATRWREAHRYTRLSHRLYGMLCGLYTAESHSD